MRDRVTVTTDGWTGDYRRYIESMETRLLDAKLKARWSFAMGLACGILLAAALLG